MSEENNDIKIPSRYDVRKGDRLKLLKFFIAMVLMIFLLLRFVVGISWVNGVSMTPTMKNGEMVFYSRLTSSFRIGDVISIKMPSGDYYIKRIVAMEGDTVDLVDGHVYVNGVLEKNESLYAYGETWEEEGNVTYPLTLEEGMLFVLGDNRTDSIDSRAYGPMAESQIRGKILFHLKMPWE